MQAQELKEYILNNDRIEDILISINCGHIVNHGEYVTASNKDGDNKQAIVIYKNENLTCINYTRTLSKDKRSTDIFDLVSFNLDVNFPKALKHVHDILGLNFYDESSDDIPDSLQLIQLFKEMKEKGVEEIDAPLKPIPNKILEYYIPYGNVLFEEDGISLDIQKEFKIGYDPQSNRITIPIYSAIGDLCGIKGRFFGDADALHSKYLYLEKCSKGKILYGYYENEDYIKNSNVIYCFEAEKSVLQAASNGVRNTIALGGKCISQYQIELIVRTGIPPCISFDKDVQMDEIKLIADEFPPGMPVYCMYDTDNIMDEKASPTDNFEIFTRLNKQLIKLR